MSTPPATRPAVQRVLDALAAQGVQATVRDFDASTRTAQDAAAAIGTTVARIVKSLVFQDADGTPLMVLASGTNRVDLARVGALVGTPIRRADAEAVRAATGFAIGGVPPLGHATPLRVLVDRDLLQYNEVWAAAGTPNAVFAVAPDILVRVSRGEVADVREEQT